MNRMETILVGTCGWSYKDWEGHFYPKGVSAGDYLSYYSERFPVVEVDSTFYGSPRPQMVQGWRDKTPEPFKFSLKVPQTITHEKLLVDCEKELEEFLSAVRILGSKLLCCVLQFGFFNSKVFASLNAFLDRLGPFLELWPKDVPLAVEIRNKYWMKKQFSDLLRRHGVGLCIHDADDHTTPMEITAAFTYIRLRRSGYTHEQRRQWQERIRSWSSEGVEVFAYIKHEDNPNAPFIALDFAKDLRDSFLPGPV